ncbi:uncharacterized protein N0V89_006555 [Didymosphaeria variabile]|uniref:Major facilitator superfamily (MFS) profile domain-containing protein n=1 Tax=Didymosphaeria variabile TaxID=1932322 RepID=A0A9W8XJ78_9PLEO|nr:uncharacterized protein N0V89_006555 [Didymosphaeria variabile]KAJ4351216.1 hypothetical protein N0V89_006555 [Didymosphaeria variabile]
MDRTHDQNDPEKAVPELDLEGETPRGRQSAADSVVGDKPVDVAKPHDDGPPDGGTTAWLVLLGSWCCSFSSPGWINSVGSFQQYYETGPLKDYSSSTIGWILSLQIFFLFALGPFVGILFDNYGPRPLIIVGTLFHVFGLMMASLAKSYYQFILAQGVCSAIGVACLYSPALMCLTTWFNKKRGAAMGVMVSGSSLGGVVFPIMIARMVPRNGYPWTMRTAAFIILGLQIIAIFTVKPRTKPVPKKMPMGRLAAPFTEFPYVMMLIGFFLLTFGIFIPITYLAVQGFQEAHMSEEMSQYIVAIFNASSLFGRLVAGVIADKIGRWNVFIIFCGLSGIAEFAVWIPATTSSVVIGFAIMFGFVSGAFISLLGALPASVSPLPEIGYRMGVVFFAISIPALVMAPIGGAILQNGSNGWLDVKIFGGVTAIAGTAIILVSRLMYTDKKLLKVF